MKSVKRMLVTSALLVAVWGMSAPAAPPPGRERPAPAGTIEGVVRLQPVPRRRTANRYPGGAAAAHQLQEVPALVYIEGAVPGAPAHADAAPVLLQRDTAFVPAAIAVPVGGTVDFTNDDEFFHNVFSYSSVKRFDLGRYPRGESKSVSFDRPGVVNVFCEVHDFMRAVIVVTENPFHTTAAEDGSFRLDGVPAGDYTLVVVQPDHRTLERPVTVRDGEVTRVEVELVR